MDHNFVRYFLVCHCTHTARIPRPENHVAIGYATPTNPDPRCGMQHPAEPVRFCVGRLPDAFHCDPARFETLWAMHPSTFNDFAAPGGRLVKLPRWQQNYGKHYRYPGSPNTPLPVPQLLRPILTWGQEAIEERLNGILVNWYGRDHYIGKHRDSTMNIVDGTPIVTVSFGETRVFRLRPWKGQGVVDFWAADGTVFVIPWATNRIWTHEVPRSRRYTGRRISVTLRAFHS